MTDAAIETVTRVMTEMRGYRYRPEAQAEAVIAALVDGGYLVPGETVYDLTEQIRRERDDARAALTETVALLRRIAYPTAVTKPEAEPNNKPDGYGTFPCGCSWDSGPYPIHCERHYPDGPRYEAINEAAAFLAGQEQP